MKDVQKLRDIRAWIQKELESSASFWLKYGMDPEHGPDRRAVLYG